jgi:lipoprotein-anchoring transpeptidase ErfK/SrfK
MRRIDETSNEQRPRLAILIEAFAVIPLLLLMPGAPAPTAAPNAPAVIHPASVPQVQPVAAPASVTPAPKPSADAKKIESIARVHRRVIVSIPDRRLALVEDDGRVLKTWRVAVGAADSPSPTGDFTIISRVTDPTYYHEGDVIPPGDDNPIGPRWIGLSQPHYAIHGTNAPRSIGKAASHGCIRMRNDEVKELFAMVHVGDSVEIHGERNEATARVFGEAPADQTVTAQTDNKQASAGSL